MYHDFFRVGYGAFRSFIMDAMIVFTIHGKMLEVLSTKHILKDMRDYCEM